LFKGVEKEAPAARLRSPEPAAIDDEVLGRARSTVVGGEEEDHLCELVGIDAPLDRLIAQGASFAFFAPPLRELTFGWRPSPATQC
jgi:hypothetical protein